MKDKVWKGGVQVVTPNPPNNPKSGIKFTPVPDGTLIKSKSYKRKGNVKKVEKLPGIVALKELAPIVAKLNELIEVINKKHLP